MDFNEAARKLSHRDPFPQVKEINNKKEESTGNRVYAGTRARVDHKQRATKSHTLWDRNGRRGGYARKAIPGNPAITKICREFRVVRDNRMNQSITKDISPGSPQNSLEENHQATSNAQEKRPSGNLIDLKHSALENSRGHGVCRNLNGIWDSSPDHSKNEKSSGSGKASLPKEKQVYVSNSPRMMLREVNNKSQAHSETFQSANSIIGVYSSSSDPIHVPASKSPSIAGAIRRDVGVVGVHRQSSDRLVTCTSSSAHSFCVHLSDRDASSSGHSPTTFISNHFNPSYASKTTVPSVSISKSFAATKYNVKLQQQVIGRRKDVQPNMEWKPKSSRKLNADNAGGTTESGQVQAAALSEKLLQINLSKIEHLIIPQHLRVPESEQARLTFGSFGAEHDSTKGNSVIKASKNADSNNGPSSTSSSVPVCLVEDSVAYQSGLVDSQERISRSDNLASAAEPELQQPVNDGSLSPRDIETYPDIGLVQSHSPPCSSHEPESQKSPPSVVDFSAYDPQIRFDMPFSKMLMEDNAQGQGLSSAHEGLSTYADSSSLSSMSLVQQQQPFTQLYPQVHISRYPNVAPCRQIFSPLYVPQLLVPNYSNNSEHIHCSSGSNYLMMPGGSPQLTSGGMKYGASQYKPVQAGNPTTGYGSYTNPGGYTVGTIGSTVGMDDMSRINFKDNTVYVPNLRADADIWIQTPRDLGNLRSTPCFNLSGQAQAYVPAAQAANPALNPVAFPSPHLQYPGLYHPSQPGSIAGQTNRIVHQQVESGMAGNSGIRMVPAAATQVGAYQQSQLGHLGWTNNF